jgi:hypothetical protein
VIIRALQGLLIAAGVLAPVATFPSGLWGGIGGGIVVAVCVFGGVCLAGLLGVLAGREQI